MILRDEAYPATSRNKTTTKDTKYYEEI